jgi:predicted metal-dependent phosphoesterase TrpH
MGIADLHTHTIYSYDGTASVSAVLKHAKRVGLDLIAITDHDEINGALKALQLAPKFGIEVIPGYRDHDCRR